MTSSTISDAVATTPCQQGSDLFDFPQPPDQTPNLLLQPMPVLGSQPASRRSSICNTSPPESPRPHVNADFVSNWVPSTESDLCVSRFKRFSKSTTSLPINLSDNHHRSFDTNEDSQFCDYQLSEYNSAYQSFQQQQRQKQRMQQVLPQNRQPSRKDQLELQADRREGPECKKDGPLSSPLYRLRAVRSHHNLTNPDDNMLLSQSMLSMVSKVELMPEVADLLSPIEYQVYDSDLDNSASTIPLASQDGVAAATSANSGTNARVLTPQPEAVPGADTKAQPLHSSQQAPDFERGQQVSVAHPQSFVPVPRKQMSMAQLEARIKSRNSMLVAGTLLPAVSMSSCDDLSNRFGPQKDESALLAEKRLRRASRYIHDAPVGAIDFGSDHMWAQLSTSSGNGEEKHIGQGFARRTNRVSQVVADQNKIYSIYGESVWHSTYTTNTNMAARQQAPFGFTSDPKTNDFTDRPGTAVSSRRGARMQTLRSVASSPMLTPWRRMWSKKTQIVPPMPLTQHPNKECWDCASSFTSSVYSGSDCSISLAAVHQSTSQSKAPTRKPSAIRLLVRKAGLSLLRRSVSFYKSVSGSGTVVQEEGFEGAVGAEFEPEMGNSISVRPKRSFRFAEIVRQAGNRLKGSLKHSEALPVTVDDDSDVISAYPSDSLPDRNLDSYLSRSTYHSPSMTTPANSATVCNDDERNDGEHGDADDEDDRSDFSNSTSNDPRSSKYMLPRRPPFLGLHRKAVTAKTNDTRSTGGPKEEDEEEEECQHSLSGQSEETITSLPSHQATNLTSNTNTVSVPTPPAPAAVHYAPVAALASSNGPRLRPTQFSSPFTTLPYGAYAHLNQLRGQSQNQHGHL